MPTRTRGAERAAPHPPAPPAPPPLASPAVAPVHVAEGFTAASVAQRNAALVADALTAAGVPHLAYDCPSSLRVVIAVPGAEADAARRALLSAAPPMGARPLPEDEPLRLADGLAAWRPDGALQLRLHQPVGDPSHRLVLGDDVACELQLWVEHDGRVRAPTQTPWGRWFPATIFAPGRHAWPPPTPIDHVDFPIDAVYTWVDDDDPAWAEQRDRALVAAGRSPLGGAGTDARFRNRDELRYSLRSLELFAPWVRHVYLVTADQVPEWLDVDSPRVTVVSHRDIFADPDNLPTFNSHAIEAHLHRVAGLSEHYLYINDDFFFGRPVRPEAFFHGNGVAKFFLSRTPLPPGPATAGDRGVDAAGKNGRRLLAETFGRRVTQKFKHVPQPQRRTVVREVVERFADAVDATAGHRFRHPDDLSVPSSLVHHYGHLQGEAVPGRVHYDYISTHDVERAEERFAWLLAYRDRDTFCINDAETDPGNVDRVDALIAGFLERYFPVPSSCERG